MTDPQSRYEVRHPQLGAVTVSAQDRYAAIVQAAKKWGERWKYIASYCTVTDLGPAKRYPCRLCGKMIQEPGYCPACQATRAQLQAQAARQKRRERGA